MIDSLIPLYVKDLTKLEDEIKLFKDERNLWKTRDGITNSAGNLAIHISGGLQHFFGNQLGHTGYIRDRDKEFSAKDIPRTEVLAGIAETIRVVNNTLSSLKEPDLEKNYPAKFGGNDVTTEYVILFLSGHLNYHLGQINYLRRMLEPGN